ncbi:MAG: DUF4215 domain-containing protein [Sandaracinaceae bacterium]|nr:DUF4215 domain-containing protein [Sandaracinaceae bacterium]
MSRAASPPDRVTPGLLLVALLSIAGCAGGQREPDTHDAGPRFDWTTVALPPLVTGCGDGLVDPGESCDDANDDDNDGCARCRWPTLCGNGVVEGAEACDDGNRINGDGCRASCELEACGDGHVDGPAETCDDESGSCLACQSAASCGDGALTEPELCDDGGSADWDGCSASCGGEQVFMVTELGFATDVSQGCDISGTGVRQNSAGQALAVPAVAWNAQIARQLRDVAARPVVIFSGWARGVAPPPRFRVAMRDAVVVDPIARVVETTTLPFDFAHIGAVEDGMESDVADLRLNTGGAVVVQEPLRRAQFRLRALPDSSSPQRVEGVLCGALEVRSLAHAMDLFGSGSANGYPLCEPVTRDLSLADLVGAGRRLGFTPTQPDVDLDGDGLEQLIIAGHPSDTCTPVIVGCVEGDGTTVNDPNCIFDFDDGWSTSFFVVAERATFAQP